MIERDDFIETLARAICTIDPLSPRPDAPIMWGMKRAKAWEPRGTILRQAIDAGLFSHPPKVWLAPMEVTMEMWAAGDRVCNDDEELHVVYAAMRDAHLKEKQT
jgi:hypothetical protein